jgi:hypothetical protein
MECIWQRRFIWRRESEFLRRRWHWLPIRVEGWSEAHIDDTRLKSESPYFETKLGWKVGKEVKGRVRRRLRLQ